MKESNGPDSSKDVLMDILGKALQQATESYLESHDYKNSRAAVVQITEIAGAINQIAMARKAVAETEQIRTLLPLQKRDFEINARGREIANEFNGIQLEDFKAERAAEKSQGVQAVSIAPQVSRAVLRRPKH